MSKEKFQMRFGLLPPGSNLLIITTIALFLHKWGTRFHNAELLSLMLDVNRTYAEGVGDA